MPKEIICSQCGKKYWDDIARCPRCGQPRGVPGAPASLDSQITTLPKGASGSGAPPLDSELTVWPNRRAPDWDGEATIFSEPQTGLLGWLIVTNGSRRGQVHQIKNGTTLGRENADLIFRDPQMSRPHAKITVQDEQFVLWDFGSVNGTYVNDQRITQATPLSENDVIKIGDTVFVLKTLL
jgi:hypothetical protein